jgi:hypothetical protein
LTILCVADNGGFQGKKNVNPILKVYFLIKVLGKILGNAAFMEEYYFNMLLFKLENYKWF